MTGKQLNILLVSSYEADYILIRDLLAEVERVEFALDWVSGYGEALEVVIRNQHQVYLVDEAVGGQSGLELVAQAVKQGCWGAFILLAEQYRPEQAGTVTTLFKEELSAGLLEHSIHYALERKSLERALREAQAELEHRIRERTRALSQANKLLREEVVEKRRLEQQIATSLKRRARQVQTSTDVSQRIAATPSLADLFRQVVNQVQEQFGYYHAHVYTLSGDDLVMQEGTGQVGRRLKEAGHKIPLLAEQSLVARAAQWGEPVLVQDVSQDSNWLPNPLLPETCSEIAVPIKLDGEILGVLDVQSNQVGGLNPEDQILLMGLCGQIAVAINNHRLEAKRRQAEAAQQKLIKELDTFAHTVSHNLRDPLFLIIGYADLLKDYARLPDEMQDYLNAIARNARKMGDIIEELQLLAGVRKAKVELKPLNMARVVAEALQRLAYLIEEHQAQIIISEYWPMALGHTPWVEEVWAGYLSNAILYGGRPPRVQLGATARSDGMIRFWVRDNGRGLAPEEQSQLFTEFTRLDNEAQIEGHGLGLSIVRRIVTKLGGQVGVESEVGQGSVFYFTLPRA